MKNGKNSILRLCIVLALLITYFLRTAASLAQEGVQLNAPQTDAALVVEDADDSEALELDVEGTGNQAIETETKNVLEETDDESIQVQASDDGGIQAVTFNGHRYQYVSQGIASTWEEAKSYCETLGGHLATISSKEENDFLYSYLTSLGKNTAYFGLSDAKSEGDWVWVTGEKTSYENWHKGEPNGGSNENYAEFYWMFTDGTWNDGNFGAGTQQDGTAFICEWDALLIGDYASGTCGDNLTWELQEGKLTIRGTGAMTSHPWTDFADVITSVDLTQGMTELCSEAFMGCTGLASITVPKNVTNIPNRTFYNCSSLESITFPGDPYPCASKLEKIYAQAVKGCASLANIYYDGSFRRWRTIDISADNTFLTGIDESHLHCRDSNKAFYTDIDTGQFLHNSGKMPEISGDYEGLGVASFEGRIGFNDGTAYSVITRDDYEYYFGALNSGKQSLIDHKKNNADKKTGKKVWDGACFGVASSIAASFVGADDSLAKAGVKRYADIGVPKKTPWLLSRINCYYLNQFICTPTTYSYFSRYALNLDKTLDRLVRNVAKDGISLFSYKIHGYNHALIAYGLIDNPDFATGEIQLYLYDIESYGLKYYETNGKSGLVGVGDDALQMTITRKDGKYTSYRSQYVNQVLKNMSNHTNDVCNEKNTKIRVFDIEGVASPHASAEVNGTDYVVLRAVPNAEVTSNNATFGMRDNDSYAHGDATIEDYFVVNGASGESAGSHVFVLQPGTRYSVMNGSDDLDISVASDDSLYAVEGTGIDSATIDKSGAITIRGTKQSFAISMPVAAEPNSEVVTIRGTSSGRVNAKCSGSGLKVSSTGQMSDVAVSGDEGETKLGGKTNGFTVRQEASGEGIAVVVDLSTATVSTIANKNWTGKAITPRPTVKMGTTTLRRGTDYTLRYMNNVDTGTAIVIVTGKGSYSGSTMTTFAIVNPNAKSLSKAKVSSIAAQPYSGKAKAPKPTVTLGKQNLKLNKDYRLSYKANTKAGNAIVVVRGMNKYKGTVSKSFSIYYDISKASVAFSKKSFAYTGKAQKPAPTVACAGTKLSSGKYYTVSYKNNIKAGNATVVIKAKGKLAKGKKTATFGIVNNLGQATVSLPASILAYTGTALQPVPTVALCGTKLKMGTHYTVSYTKNTSVGTSTVTVKGKGGFKGSRKVSFAIAYDIEDATLTLPKSSYEYTGEAIAPAPIVTCADVTLVAGKHYTVSYSKNTDAGTAEVIVNAKTDAIGSAKKTFAIAKANLSKGTVTFSKESYGFTLDEVTPEPTVEFGSKTLKAGIDYKVDYANNIEPGTATATITGLGNYSGSASATFAIVYDAKIVRSGTWGSCPWELDSDGMLTVRPGEGSETNAVTHASWDEYKDDIRIVRFVKEGSAGVTCPESVGSLFANYENLERVVMAPVDFSKVRNMRLMFYGCLSLTKLDLASLDTSRVRDMYGAFASTALDSKTLMSLDTSGADNVGCLFRGCTKLDEFDLAALKLDGVKSLDRIFAGSSITHVYASEPVTIRLAAQDGESWASDFSPFSGCAKLRSADLSNVTLAFDGSGIHFISTFVDCGSLESVVMPAISCEQVALTFTFTRCNSLKNVDLAKLGSAVVGGFQQVFMDCVSVETIDFSSLCRCVAESTEECFKGCSSLKKLNLTGWDTSNLTTAYGMFQGCSNLVELDLSTWDVEVLENVANMFDGCPAPRPSWWSSVPRVQGVSVRLGASRDSDPNGSVRLVAEYYPPDAVNQSVAWSSSDTSVATVDNDGLVQIVGGTASGQSVTISAKSANGKVGKFVLCGIQDNFDVEMFENSIMSYRLDVAWPNWGGETQPFEGSIEIRDQSSGLAKNVMRVGGSATCRVLVPLSSLCQESVNATFGY